MASALLFIGCEKEEPKDELAPELIVTGLHESKLLVNEEHLRIEATDEREIEKVEIFLGSELVNTFSAAPYDMHINSAAYDDGEYELKVIASDKAGNQKEWKKAVKVSNTLLVIHTDQLWESEKHEYFYLVSDTAGKPLSSSVIQIGETYEIKSPDNYYGSAGFSLFRLENYSSAKDLLVTSLLEVERGAGLQWDNFYGRTATGTYEVEVSNMDGGRLVASGKDGSLGYISSNGSQTIKTFGNPQEVLLVKHPSGNAGEEPAFKLVENVLVNSTLAVDYASINTPFHSIELNLPASQNVSMAVNGFNDQGDKVFIMESSNKLFYFPASVFPAQGVTIGVGNADGSYSSMYKKVANPAELEFESLQLAIGIEKNANKLRWNITGEDYTYHFAYMIGGLEKAFIKWRIAAPKESENIILPMLTEELKALTTDFGDLQEVELQLGGGVKFLPVDDAGNSNNMLELLRETGNLIKDDFLITSKVL